MESFTSFVFNEATHLFLYSPFGDWNKPIHLRTVSMAMVKPRHPWRVKCTEQDIHLNLVASDIRGDIHSWPERFNEPVNDGRATDIPQSRYLPIRSMICFPKMWKSLRGLGKITLWSLNTHKALVKAVWQGDAVFAREPT